MIHGHGDDYYSASEPLVADFSSNVRWDGCPAELIAFLQQRLPEISHYPEPAGESLQNLLAEKYELLTEQVLLCNGSSDGFYLLAQAFSGAKSAVLIPSFAEYEDACNMHNHQLQFFKKDNFLASDFSSADLVWLANPNNPDGFIFEVEWIQEKLKAFPNTVFVLDEAYEEMCPAAHSAIHLLRDFDNLVVCRSLTKTYGIPGIRLGYLLTGKALAWRLNCFLRPWTVNVLALEAGKYILQNEAQLKTDAQRISEISQSLQQQVNELDGFHVSASNAGFFLVKMEKHSAAVLKKYLLKNHRILIRDASNFRGLDTKHFRLGIQTEEKNQLLLKALKEFTKLV